MKIVVAGGTGFVGQALSRALAGRGHEVLVLTRRPDSTVGSARVAVWDATHDAGPWAGELRGSGAVVNLAGASIGGGRWTRARKRVLVESRVRATEALVQAIAALPATDRPAALITASGVDYYGDHPGDEALDESAPAGGSFLGQLCVQWENAALKAVPLGVRVVQIRTAFCIGRGALALRLLVLPFRLFAGGPLGSGRQWFTWIHLDDLVNLYVLAIEDSALAGPVNAVAPGAARERAVAHEIGRVLHRPSWAPAPGIMLRLVLGEMADLLLHGRNAVPGRALASGYRFKYTEVGAALEDALRVRVG